MRIVYVAKHDSGGNDDEGAITHALLELGHDVQRVREVMGKTAYRVQGDLLLFHKWAAVEHVIKCDMPRVFWFFDLVDYPDPTLRSRNHTRIRWMERMLPHIDLGFCTDGDWVARDTTGKLVTLRQGADGRILGRGTPSIKPRPHVLFTGIERGGRERQWFCERMRKSYGVRFDHIQHGVYREALADRIAEDRVVVCPLAPVTDRYWSNRIYNAAGFGGCVLHRDAAELHLEYEADEEVIYYYDLRHLDDLLGELLAGDGKRARRLGEAALERTRREHTYRHRCEELLRVVGERLGVK